MTPHFVIVTDRCAWGWAGCEWMYTGGHLCDRKAGHAGACKCGCCGAKTTVSRATRAEAAAATEWTPAVRP